ncbi:MAG TPA: hypothetical protein VK743_20340, partial [Steroidobacteraceae bacterium]|nr:hypothetical protein [Steroidobacteraceae bacterium]
FDAAFERFAAGLDGDALPEAHARRFAQSFVTLMQAKLLIAGAATPSARAAAEGFCATRLGDDGWGAVFGAGRVRVDSDAILARAWQGG